MKYTYSIEPPIPFDQEGMIFYDDLEQWTHKHKSNRLKRLRQNFRDRFPDKANHWLIQITIRIPISAFLHPVR